MVVPIAFAGIFIMLVKERKPGWLQSFVLKREYEWSCHQVKGKISGEGG